MKPNIIIKCLMTIRGCTRGELAEKMGKANPSSITNSLTREYGMRIDTLLEMVNALDAEVVIRSKGEDKTEWVID